MGPDFFDGVEPEARKRAERVRAGCRALPDPTPASLFDSVHVTMPDELRQQRDEFCEFVSALDASDAR